MTTIPTQTSQVSTAIVFTDDMDPRPQREPTRPDCFALVRATLVHLNPTPQTAPVNTPKQEAVWKK